MNYIFMLEDLRKWSEKNFDSLSVNEASLEIKGMLDPKAL